MFPPGSTALPGATAPLDDAPPSPQSMGGGPTGQPTAFSLGAVAPPLTPSDQLPPEILTAIVQASQDIGSKLDSFAQVTPDMAVQWAAVKDHLQQVLAQLMTKGAGSMSPTATGQQFPGGGIDRGIAGAGAV